MINLNAFRWLSILLIVILVAVLEMTKHLYYMNILPMLFSHLLNIASVSVIVFIVSTVIFKMLDKQNKKIMELNANLKEINKALEEKIEKRTIELQQMLESLKKEHEELEKTHKELASTYQNLQKDETELAKREKYALKEEKISRLNDEIGKKTKTALINLSRLKQSFGEHGLQRIESIDRISDDIAEISKLQGQLSFWMQSIDLKG